GRLRGARGALRAGAPRRALSRFPRRPMSRYFCHEYPEILLVETRVVDARPGAVLLEQSPFHPGGGGQLADRGVLRWSGGELRVVGIEAVDGRYWHLVGEAVEMSGA